MDQDIIRLLRKYVNNRCTAQELQKVRAVLTSGKYDQEWAAVSEEEALRDMADNSEIEYFDSKSVLHRITNSIKPARKISKSRWALGIAASLFLILSAGYFFWQVQLRQVTNGPLLSLVTAAGQQKKIVLADGTEIILNCGSTLSYTAEFVGAKREVYLNGEAFFKVTHDQRHPFIVHTNRLIVQVLGTSFNISAYKTDAKAMVSVATGKVGVNGAKPTPTYLLLPGERLSYNGKNEFKKDNISLDEIMGWQNGMISFHLETIHEIVPVLERYYGIIIHIDHEQKPEKQVTASFNRKTLPQVLEILAQTAGFHYVINKNEVHIN